MPLTSAFLKKFIQYAKTRVRPELSPAASEEIASYYTSLRQFQACPKVTVRMLETIIRLATAHAKMRHKVEVEASDVEAIKRILDAVTGFSSEATELDDLEKTAAASMRRVRDAQGPARGAKRTGRGRARPSKRSGGSQAVEQADKEEADESDSEAESDEEVAAAAEGEDGSDGEAEEEVVEEEDGAGPSEPFAVGDGAEGGDPVLAALVTKVLRDLLRAVQQENTTHITWERLAEEVHLEQGGRVRKYDEATVKAEAQRQAEREPLSGTVMVDDIGLFVLS